MEGGFEMKCPKCGSGEHSIRWGAQIITRNVCSKRPEHRLECDDCGFDWKWD